MKSSLQIGAVSGIGIFLHWTFGLLIAGLFAFYLAQGSTVGVALAGVGVVLALFGCVVLHELGHALMARRFGVPTLGITLYPIGGVARLQRLPEEPMKEFWIAVAGPAVNLVIALAMAGLLLATGGRLAPQLALDPGAGALSTLLWLNLALFAFNLLPAFPMDGGRVLRALLAARMDYGRATQIAAYVGQGMAVVFGLVGLVWFNPVLVFIALFVYAGARQEAQQAALRKATEGVLVQQVMTTPISTLAPDDALGRAVDALLAGAEHDFPVVDGDAVVGLLTRPQLLEALAEHGRTARVGDVAGPPCFTAEAEATLIGVARRMQAAGCAVVPVAQEGRLVGVLTLEDASEWIGNAAAGRSEDVPQDPSRTTEAAPQQ